MCGPWHLHVHEQSFMRSPLVFRRPHVSRPSFVTGAAAYIVGHPGDRTVRRVGCPPACRGVPVPPEEGRFVMLDHVSVTVSDLAHSAPFWDAVMAALSVP